MNSSMSFCPSVNAYRVVSSQQVGTSFEIDIGKVLAERHAEKDAQSHRCSVGRDSR